MIHVQITLTENGWLALARDDSPERWISLKYETQPTPAKVRADAREFWDQDPDPPSGEETTLVAEDGFEVTA